jgi:sucrose-6-phosphate hydrolase SacC (GH32 family)
LAEFGIKLRCSPDGEEQTRLVYDKVQERLVVEPNQSSLSTVVDRDMRKAPLSLGKNGLLKLHIFLDRSVLEVFANEHTCLVSRIYPTRPDSLGLDLFARNGSAKLKTLDIWEMKSIWD